MYMKGKCKYINKAIVVIRFFSLETLFTVKIK